MKMDEGSEAKMTKMGTDQLIILFCVLQNISPFEAAA